MSELVHYVAAVSAAILWIPILIQFFRNWHRRHNPLSLAIAALIIFVIFFVMTPFWLLYAELEARVIMLVNEGIGFLVLINFYVAFWFGRKFKSTRQTPVPK